MQTTTTKSDTSTLFKHRCFFTKDKLFNEIVFDKVIFIHHKNYSIIKNTDAKFSKRIIL